MRRAGRLGPTALACLAVTIAIGSRSARAEDAPPAPPPPAPAPPPIPPALPPTDEEKARALDSVRRGDVDVLPDLWVTAPTLTPRRISEVPQPVNLITREKMDRELPRSMSDAIRNQPGLWTAGGSNGQMGTPVLRGMQGNQVLQLLDGARISNDLTPTGPGPDWDLIDPEMLERIEVVRCPDSCLFGTQAIGGVTALYTGWPLDYADCGVRWGGHSRVTYATGGENLWRVRVQGQVATPTFRAVVGGTYWDADDMVAPDEAGTQHPTAFVTDGFDARVEFRSGACDRFGLSAFVMEKEYDGNFLRPSRVQDNTTGRYVGIARWNHDAPTAWADDFEARFSWVYNIRVSTRRDVYDRIGQETSSPQADFVAHKGVGCAHLLTYGAHWHRESVNAWETKTAGTTDVVTPGTLDNAGVYLQDEWDVSPRWRLTAGVRVDGVWVSTDPDPARLHPLVDLDRVTIDRSDSAFTWKFGALYRASGCVDLTGLVSRGYRFPAISDLASFRPAPDEIVVGTPTLSPEYSTNAEIGLHLNTPCVRAAAAVYSSWYEDLIIGRPGLIGGSSFLDLNGNAVQDPDEDYLIRQNAGSAQMYGFEAAAAWNFRPSWTVFGNFTYWGSDIDPAPTEPVGVPTNGTLGLRFEPSECFWAEGAAHMVRKFSDIEPGFYNDEAFFFKNPQSAASGPLRDDHSVPGYTTFDLRAGANVGHGITLTAAVENLFDKQYRAFGSRHDAPGITFVFGATFDF